jgi:predicted nucleotidyltransferase
VRPPAGWAIKNLKIFEKITNHMETKKQQVMQQIKNLLTPIVPQGTRVILFGSQARGDARPDSDWDVLIVLDKQRLERSDYDDYCYPLRELGWSLKECINPVMYTLKDWLKYHFTPFYHNVTEEGVAII